MNPIDNGADNARNKHNVPPHPPDGAEAPPRQPRQEFSSWPIELNRNHLSEGALARATRVMESALCQDVDDGAFEWRSSDSSDDSAKNNSSSNSFKCGNST